MTVQESTQVSNFPLTYGKRMIFLGRRVGISEIDAA